MYLMYKTMHPTVQAEYRNHGNGNMFNEFTGDTVSSSDGVGDGDWRFGDVQGGGSGATYGAERAQLEVLITMVAARQLCIS